MLVKGGRMDSRPFRDNMSGNSMDRNGNGEALVRVA
jgi:hypothetical protein